MKRLASLLVAGMLLGGIFPVSAQDHAVLGQPVQTKESKSKNNWFISLGAGATLLQAEQDPSNLIKDRLLKSGSLELSVGKWFNPYFGARVQLQGGLLRGWNETVHMTGLVNGFYLKKDRGQIAYPKGVTLNPDGTLKDWGKIELKENDGTPGFWQDFKYAGASLDLLFNLTNLWRGYYNETNRFDFIPYAGIGLVNAFDSPTNSNYLSFGLKAGMRVNWNISSKFSIFLEPQTLAVSREFDGYVGNRLLDMVNNVFLGVQLNLNKDMSEANTSAGISVEELYYLNDRINENRSLIDKQAGIADDQQDLINRLEGRVSNVEKLVQNAKPVSSDKYLPECIYFSLNSARIPIFEQQKLVETAAYLKKNPNSKLLLVGYADRKTGDAGYNMSLSRKRTEVVADALKKLGVSANSLVLEWKGDKEQPFQQNDWNRVVVLVERK